MSGVNPIGMGQGMDKNKAMTMYGAVRAARAALDTTNYFNTYQPDAKLEKRVAEIDELLRALGRDLAREAGL